MGLVCRVVEEAGIPTVCVSTGRDITALVRPPRSYFVNAPMGNNFGAPDDRETQTRILRAVLALAAAARAPGRIVDETRCNGRDPSPSTPRRPLPRRWPGD